MHFDETLILLYFIEMLPRTVSYQTQVRLTSNSYQTAIRLILDSYHDTG